jgi:hypothetical protein
MEVLEQPQGTEHIASYQILSSWKSRQKFSKRMFQKFATNVENSVLLSEL